MEKCDDTTPKSFLNRFEEARQGDEINFTCGDCHSLNPLPICYSCTPDDVMPVVNELFRDVPDDDDNYASHEYNDCADDESIGASPHEPTAAGIVHDDGGGDDDDDVHHPCHDDYDPRG